LLLLFIFTGCDAVSFTPGLTAEALGSQAASETRHVVTPTFTATATVAPSQTSTPSPTLTPIPSPTKTPYRLEDGEIGYTAYVIDDPNDPFNAHHWEAHLIQLNNLQPAPLIENLSPTYSPKWSPDGKRIAFLGGDQYPSSLFILDLETRQTHEIENVWEYDWSRDGQALVYCEYGTWPWAEDEAFHFYLVSNESCFYPSQFIQLMMNGSAQPPGLQDDIAQFRGYWTVRIYLICFGISNLLAN
jgi:Tol biopolymer transport system component